MQQQVFSVNKGDSGRQNERNAKLLTHLLFGDFQGVINGFDRGF